MRPTRARRRSRAVDLLEAPWRSDVDAARKESLERGKPCVLILNADSGAL